MKARFKSTGEIVEVVAVGDYINENGQIIGEYKDANDFLYTSYDLDFYIEEAITIPDYWDRLTHQAAISAMHGIMSNPVGFESIRCTTKDCDKKVAEIAICFAKELVEGLKLIRSN